MVQARVLDGSARLTAAIPPVERPPLGDAASLHGAERDARRARAARKRSLRARPASCGRLMQTPQPRHRVGGARRGQDHARGRAHGRRAREPLRPGCEEIREIAVPVTHGAYYEVRPPSLDGTGEISLRDLVKFVLAMRPDRIVVGEVRGAEAFELSRAVNAGCGFLCTVHANSAIEALHALVNAALMAGENVTERVVRKVFSESLDLVVHVDRDDLAARRRRRSPAGGARDRRRRARAERRLHRRAGVRARRAGRAHSSGPARSRRGSRRAIDRVAAERLDAARHPRGRGPTGMTLAGRAPASASACSSSSAARPGTRRVVRLRRRSPRAQVGTAAALARPGRRRPHAAPVLGDVDRRRRGGVRRRVAA